MQCLRATCMRKAVVTEKDGHGMSGKRLLCMHSQPRGSRTCRCARCGDHCFPHLLLQHHLYTQQREQACKRLCTQVEAGNMQQWSGLQVHRCRGLTSGGRVHERGLHAQQQSCSRAHRSSWDPVPTPPPALPPHLEFGPGLLLPPPLQHSAAASGATACMEISRAARAHEQDTVWEEQAASTPSAAFRSGLVYVPPMSSLQAFAPQSSPWSSIVQHIRLLANTQMIPTP